MENLTKMQKDTAVKEAVLDKLGAVLADATQIGAFEYAIPVFDGEEDRYCKLSLTACLSKATKTNPAFDPIVAAAKYSAKVEDAAQRAAERAAAKAAKETK